MAKSFREKFFAKSPMGKPGEPSGPTGENKPLSAKEQFIRSVRTSKPGTPSTDALKNQEEFLDHPFYRQNALNVWGADASDNIKAQKERMRNVVISQGPLEKATAIHKAPFFPPGEKDSKGNPLPKELTQGKITYDTRSNKYLPHALGNATHDVEHELGHASDVAAQSVENQTKDRMYPEYEGYSNLNLKTNTGSEAFDNYLAKPTEFRTRLNHVKKLMTKDGFNWNNATGAELNHYIKDKLRLKDPTKNSPDNSVHGLKAAEYQELLQFQQYNKDKDSNNQNKKFLEKVFHDLADEPYKPDGSDYWNKFYNQNQQT